MNTYAIGAGTLIALDGAYQCFKGNPKRGLAELAVGAGLLVGGYLYDQTSDLPQPTQEDESVQQCSLEQLENHISSLTEGSDVKEFFSIFNRTIGASCENFLPWKTGFGSKGYIDEIKPSDLSKSAMWGIDYLGRFFVTVKYHCGNLAEKTTTIFQRYSTSQDHVVTAGHYSGYCLPTPFDVGNVMMERLQKLFEKGTAIFIFGFGGNLPGIATLI